MSSVKKNSVVLNPTEEGRLGLQSDVRDGLDRLCAKLALHRRGARRMRLELRRVDRAAAQVEIGLARPMRDPARIAALVIKGVEEIDAGFGIDALRLSVPLDSMIGFALPIAPQNSPRPHRSRSMDTSAQPLSD